jgi:hypothetical protein
MGAHHKIMADAFERVASGEARPAFPYGESDDAHDAAIWGLLRIRRGGFRIATEEEEEEEGTPRTPRKYY